MITQLLPLINTILTYLDLKHNAFCDIMNQYVNFYKIIAGLQAAPRTKDFSGVMLWI